MKPKICPYDVYKKGGAYTHSDVKSLLIFGDYPSDVAFSIFILTYKRLDTLKDAVLSALNQKKPSISYRVIVLDNSGLGEPEQQENESFLKSLNDERLVYYANESNIGAGNWNRLFEISHSKYLSMLHDDDILYDNYLLLVEALLKNDIMRNTAMVLPKKDYVMLGDIKESHSVNNVSPKTDNVIKVMSISETRMLLRGYSLQNSPSPGSIFDRDIMLGQGGFPYDAGPKNDDIPAWSLVRKYKVKAILSPSCGENRLAKNSSMEPRVMKNIVIKACEIHKCVYQKNIWWKIYYRLFASALFTSQVNTQLATAKKGSASIDATEFSPYVYKKRRFRLYIIKTLSRLLRLFTKFEYVRF